MDEADKLLDAFQHAIENSIIQSRNTVATTMDAQKLVWDARAACEAALRKAGGVPDKEIVELDDLDLLKLTPQQMLIRYVASCEQFIRAIYADDKPEAVEYWHRCRNRNHTAMHKILEAAAPQPPALDRDDDSVTLPTFPATEDLEAVKDYLAEREWSGLSLDYVREIWDAVMEAAAIRAMKGET